MNDNGLKKGFEVYYFDGKGGRQGPIDFEEMLELMGVLDAEERAASDDTLYEQLPLPLAIPLQSSEEEGLISDRESEEQADTGTGGETTEGTS